MLRQTWYDAARGSRPRPEHQALAAVPGVHVRLGWVVDSSSGPIQKAVDTTIVRDIVVAAFHRVADDVVLIAGDGDLVPGLREAIDRGLRIHLWGFSLDDPRVRQSEELIALADRRLTLDIADLSPHVRSRNGASTGEHQGPAATTTSLTDSLVNRGTDVDLSPGPGIDHEASCSSPALDEELTTEGHVLRSPSRPLTEHARLGPPPLLQLSTSADYEQDLAEDLQVPLDARDVGSRYGTRWWARATVEGRARFLTVAYRPGLPRLLDSDLIRYARSREIDIDNEDARRDLRAGFWTAVDDLIGGSGP